MNLHTNRIRYIRDVQRYAVVGTRKLYDELRMIEVLQRSCGYDIKRAMEVLSMVRELQAIDSQSELPEPGYQPKKGEQKAKAREALARVYEVLNSRLRLLRAPVPNGVTFYRSDEHGEVARIGQLDLRLWSDFLTSNREALTVLNGVAEAEPDLANLGLRNLVAGLYEAFMADPDTLLDHDPAPLRFGSGPAYRVIQPDLILPGPHPTWDEFLRRLDHPETFKAFVWSIFEQTNEGRQILWVMGDGNDGKSSALNVLADYYGRHAVLTVNDNFSDDDFFFGHAQGKRFGLFMDCKNTQLIREGRIKQLTGGDTVTINRKFEAPYAARVFAKLIVASNLRPSIDANEAAERTRLLLVKVSPTPNNEMGDVNFVPNLRKEVGAFLASCREAYPAQCPNGMNLLVPAAMAETIETTCVNEDTNALDEFIASHIELNEVGFVARSELDKVFRRFLSDQYLPTNQFKFLHLCKRLDKLAGVKQARPRIGDKQVRGFTGISLRVTGPKLAPMKVVK